jgi:hypothetical protein
MLFYLGLLLAVIGIIGLVVIPVVRLPYGEDDRMSTYMLGLLLFGAVGMLIGYFLGV